MDFSQHDRLASIFLLLSIVSQSSGNILCCRVFGSTETLVVAMVFCTNHTACYYRTSDMLLQHWFLTCSSKSMWPFNVTKRHKNPKKFQQLSSNWHVCTKIFVLLVPGNFDCFSCDDLKLNRHASGKINCRLIAALCFVIENFPCEIETVYCN